MNLKYLMSLVLEALRVLSSISIVYLLSIARLSVCEIGKNDAHSYQNQITMY